MQNFGMGFDPRVPHPIAAPAMQPASQPAIAASAQYGELFSRKEQQYGLPSGTLAAIAGSESSFNPQAQGQTLGTGSAHRGQRAMGMFQFMPATWQKYGQGGDPFNPEHAADAAARFLSERVQKHGGNLAEAVADYYGRGKAPAGHPTTLEYVKRFGQKLAQYGGGQVQGIAPPAATPSVAISPDQTQLFINGNVVPANNAGAIAQAFKTPGRMAMPQGFMPTAPEYGPALLQEATTPNATFTGGLKSFAQSALNLFGGVAQAGAEALLSPYNLTRDPVKGETPIETANPGAALGRLFGLDQQSFGDQAALGTLAGLQKSDIRDLTSIAQGLDEASAGGLWHMFMQGAGSLGPVIAATLLGAPGAGMVVGGLGAGGVNLDEARNDLKRLPKDQWAQSPEYTALRQQGADHAAAVDYIATKGALLAGALSAPVGALDAFLPGLSKASGAVLKSIASRPGRAAAQFGGGAMFEGSQEVLEKLAAKQGTEWGSGVAQNIWEGTGGEFVGGAMVGGPVSATFGGFGALPQQPTAPGVPPPPAQPQGTIQDMFGAGYTTPNLPPAGPAAPDFELTMQSGPVQTGVQQEFDFSAPDAPAPAAQQGDLFPTLGPTTADRQQQILTDPALVEQARQRAAQEQQQAEENQLALIAQRMRAGTPSAQQAQPAQQVETLGTPADIKARLTEKTGVGARLAPTQVNKWTTRISAVLSGEITSQQMLEEMEQALTPEKADRVMDVVNQIQAQRALQTSASTDTQQTLPGIQPESTFQRNMRERAVAAEAARRTGDPVERNFDLYMEYTRALANGDTATATRVAEQAAQELGQFSPEELMSPKTSRQGALFGPAGKPTRAAQGKPIPVKQVIAAKKEKANAVQEPSPEKVDVREQAGDGRKVGEGNPAQRAAARARQAKNEVPVRQEPPRPAAEAPARNVTPPTPVAAKARQVKEKARAQTTETKQAEPAKTPEVPAEKVKGAKSTDPNEPATWEQRIGTNALKPEDGAPSEGMDLLESIDSALTTNNRDRYTQALMAIASTAQGATKHLRKVANEFLEHMAKTDADGVRSARVKAAEVEESREAREKLEEVLKQQLEAHTEEDPEFSKTRPRSPENRTTVQRIKDALRSWFITPTGRLVIGKTFDDLGLTPAQKKRVLAKAGNPATTQAFVLDGKAYLIADNIAEGAEMAVFLHEVGAHLGLNGLEVQIMSRVNAWANAPKGSPERKIYDAMQARMEAAGETSLKEQLAYAIEEAVKAGIVPKAVALAPKVQDIRTVQDLINFMAKHWRKAVEALFGKRITSKFEPQHLVDLAYGAARDAMARESVGADVVALASKKEVDAVAGMSDAAFATAFAAVTNTPEHIKILMEGASIPPETRKHMMREALRLRALDKEPGPEQLELLFSKIGAPTVEQVKHVFERAPQTKLWEKIWKGFLTKGTTLGQLIQLGKDVMPSFENYRAGVEKMDVHMKRWTDRLLPTAVAWDAMSTQDRKVFDKLLQDSEAAGFRPDKPFTDPANRQAREDKSWESVEDARKAYDTLAARFNKLPEAHRVYISEVFDAGTAAAKEYVDATIAGVNRTITNPEDRKMITDRLNRQWKDALAGRPYLPHRWYGDWRVEVTYKNGDREVIAFDSQRQASEAERDLRAQGHEARYFSKGDFFANQRSFSRTAMNEINAAIDRNLRNNANAANNRPEIADALRRAVQEAWFSSQPETAGGQRFRTRKGTKGWERGDLNRAWVQSMQAISNLTAKMMYMDTLRDAIDDADRQSGRSHDVYVLSYWDGKGDEHLNFKARIIKSAGELAKERDKLPAANYAIHRIPVAGGSEGVYAALDQAPSNEVRKQWAEILAPEADKLQAEYKAQRFSSEETAYRAALANALKARYENMLDADSTHPVSAALTTMGFVYYLGWTPAFALMNLTQVPMLTFPRLAAKFTARAAVTALKDAYKVMYQNRNIIIQIMRSATLWQGESDLVDIQKLKGLRDDQKQLLQYLLDRNALDFTQDSEMNTLAKGTPKAVQRVIKSATWLAHPTEVSNRIITGLATYELARQNGQSVEDARKTAYDVTQESQMNYTPSNRMLLLNNPVMRPILQFQQFGQQVTWTLGRAIMQSFSKDPALRREQQAYLRFVLMSSLSLGGVMGAPFVATVLGLVSMMGGDDDRPMDAAYELEKVIGPIAARGVISQMLTDWSRRTGLGDVLPIVGGGVSRPPEATRVDTLKSFIFDAIGPLGGIARGVAESFDWMDKGESLRALEAAAPKAWRDALKAARYGQEGLTSRDGTVRVGADEFTVADLFAAAIGFRPAPEGDTMMHANYMLKVKKFAALRGGLLTQQMLTAREIGDAEAIAEAQARIDRFNEINPTFAITGRDLRRAILTKGRRQNVSDMLGGVGFTKQDIALYRELFESE